MACHSQNKESVRFHWDFYIKKIVNFSQFLLLYFSRNLNGTISLIWVPQYIMYLKRVYCMLMPISENISLIIKLQNEEQNWTKSSVSFYRFHYFLSAVWSLKYKISSMTENIRAFNYYNSLQLLPKKFWFGEFKVGWLIVKTWLSVEADAFSVLVCGKSN